MLKTILILSDGTVISSGPNEKNAIQSLTLTQVVNSGTELTLGSVCAAMAELTLIAPGNTLTVRAGEEITLIREEDGKWHILGIFITEKPIRSAGGSLKLTAYDRVSLLDRDLTQWLESLTGWPYRLWDFAKMVCDACSVELVESQLPNAEYAVEKFSAKGITGRKLLQWAGQIFGRFCHATPGGKLEFSWYVNNPVVIKPSGADGNFYYSGSLQLSDYQVKPVEKVQLQATGTDIGTLWPADVTESVNTYQIAGNYLLTASKADALKPIAQTLYEQLSNVTYTPCKLRLPAACGVQAGDVITVTDTAGGSYTVYVMKKVQSGQSDTLECTGSKSRLSSSAVNELSLQALSGKVTELSLTVDGVKAENRDASGNLARVSLALGSIEAQVASQQENVAGIQENITQLRQETGQLRLSVQSVQNDGVSRVQTETGYCFDKNGLSIHRSGSNMENLLDDTGMYVNRSGSLVLRANDEGVAAVDVTVKNYLILGDHARFEDYAGDTETNRTACFWI